MSDFMPSNKTIDDIVQGVTGPEGFERMREGIKEALAANPLAAPAPRPVLSAPEARPTHLRVVYPHGNDRVELYGSSEQELDAREAALRGLYSGL
jgi:hypothetical protein